MFQGMTNMLRKNLGNLQKYVKAGWDMGMTPPPLGQCPKFRCFCTETPCLTIYPKGRVPKKKCQSVVFDHTRPTTPPPLLYKILSHTILFSYLQASSGYV